jgi:isomerase DpgB
MDVLDVGEVALRVNGDEPLAELTTQLGKVCAVAEDDTANPVVALWLGPAADGRSWPADADVGQINRWERAVRRWERLAAVTVAVAEGPCGGPALDLLLATDHRIVTPDFRLTPPVHDGQFWPGMAMYRLANQIGAVAARRFVLRPGEVDAARAADIGLVDEISEDPREGLRRASVMRGGPELAIRRALLLDAPTTSFDDALGSHLAACDRELRRLRAGR